MYYILLSNVGLLLLIFLTFKKAEVFRFKLRMHLYFSIKPNQKFLQATAVIWINFTSTEQNRSMKIQFKSFKKLM